MNAGAETGVGARAAAERGRRLALATLSAVLFLTFLDTTIVSVALADVQSSLHAGVSQLQWVVNGYALTFAALMLGMGMLGDRLGRRRVMLAGLAVFVGGSVAGALAPSVTVLVVSRVVMGVGAAASEPGTLSILRHLYPERDARARALGVWAAVAGLALAMGPVIGGVLVGLSGWRLVFWFNLAAGLAVLAAAGRTVPESADPRGGRLDVAGLVLGPVALGTAIFAVIHGESTGYADTAVLALFAVGAAAAVLFVLAERRSPEPGLRPPVPAPQALHRLAPDRLRRVLRLFAIFFFTALYLQVVTGYSAYRTAALFVPMAVAMIAASAFTGRWVARAGPRAAGGARLPRRRRRHTRDRRRAARPGRLHHARRLARPRRARVRRGDRAGDLGGARRDAGRALRHGRRRRPRPAASSAPSSESPCSARS